MAGNPRIVTEEVTFSWDGVSQRLPKGQVVDVPEGSELEDAIGADKLVPLAGGAAHGAGPVPAPATEEAPPEEESPAPRKSRAKTSDDESKGDE